eukprot:365408-Chlamydomonas_euryale.AAC.7
MQSGPKLRYHACCGNAVAKKSSETRRVGRGASGWAALGGPCCTPSGALQKPCNRTFSWAGPSRTACPGTHEVSGPLSGALSVACSRAAPAQ